jgi:hypothetical protein
MPRKQKPPMMVKVRVIIEKPMRTSEAVELVQRAIRTRIVPDGISIEWVDWSRVGVRGRAASGRYLSGAAVDALRDMAPALNHPQTDIRVEKVS